MKFERKSQMYWRINFTLALYKGVSGYSWNLWGYLWKTWLWSFSGKWCERRRGIVLKAKEVQITFGVVPKYRSGGFDFDRHQKFDSRLMDSVTKPYITNKRNLSGKCISSQDLSTFTWSGKTCKHACKPPGQPNPRGSVQAQPKEFDPDSP